MHALPHATLAPAISGPVLLASNGGAPNDATVFAARRAAERLGVALEVVAVLEPLPVQAIPYAVNTLPAEFDEERRAALQGDVVRRLAPVLGPPDTWRLRIEYGPIGRTIADVARRTGAGLVVLGSGGHRLRDRLMGEEVSLRVVRHTTCPVLAVAPELDHPIRRAVVGVDFSAASVRAALAALALIEPGPDGAGLLVLVHVRSPFEHAFPVLAPFATGYEADVADRFAHLRELLRRRAPEDVVVETRSRTGGVPATVLDAADEVGADVVAVGTHGAGWVERLFVGSVATGTLRHAGRSVLVTPPPNAIDRVRLELGVIGGAALDRASDWPAALDAFTRRNAGRRARLDVHDAVADTRAAEAVGYRFLGAAYDPHDRRVELMLGDDPTRARRITHTVPDVRSIEIVAREDGPVDRVLVIDHAAGDTALTFLDDAGA